MIVHTGAARHTITLDDGSVWSWKGEDLGGGAYWLSGMDFPARLLDETTDGPYHARRAEPIRYNDGQPLTDAERAGLAEIRAAGKCPDNGRGTVLHLFEIGRRRCRCGEERAPSILRDGVPGLTITRTR